MRSGTEGSRTTKFGPDEQEPYMRHKYTGKQAHHCNAQRTSKVHLCRYGRHRVKEDAVTWGGLHSHGSVQWKNPVYIEEPGISVEGT